jgi:predicted RNA-binding protein with PIN domain
VVRIGSSRRGVAGERGLKPDVPDTLLFPALEAAWLVARMGERASPPQHAPRAVRRLLQHARLTAGAAKVVRKALNEDDEFRTRVAAVATEEAVGRAGVLFLARPEGWEDELGDLVAAEAESEEVEGEEREKRTTLRRLKGAERARRRAEEALAEVKAQATRAAADLAEERQGRRAAEAEVRALTERVAAVEQSASATDIGDADELLALRRRVEELEAAPERVVEVVRPAEAQAPVESDPVLRARIRELLGDAAAAAQGLATSLAAAAAELEAAATPATEAPAAPPPPVSRPLPPRRRTPAPLLPGIHDDSVEAAEYLVRRGGALLLVDGYNASLRYRPDLAIAELRRRFVDALDELAARTGVDIHVVFDGAEDGGTAVRGVSRRGRTRVTFSPADVEADDVILELVGATPAARVVLVASDDRRVRTGSEEQGANLFTIDQLLAVLRRERE